MPNDPHENRMGRVVGSTLFNISLSYTMDKTDKTDIGQKSFTVTGLPIFGIGNTRATFQLSGKMFLLIEVFMWTIGDVIWSTTGLRNFTRILLWPLEQSFLRFKIIFCTSS